MRKILNARPMPTVGHADDDCAPAGIYGKAARWRRLRTRYVGGNGGESRSIGLLVVTLTSKDPARSCDLVAGSRPGEVSGADELRARR